MKGHDHGEPAPSVIVCRVNIHTPDLHQEEVAMQLVQSLTVASVIILLVACRSKEIHLYDKEGYGPNTAEISIKGDKGMAYWRWGQKTFAMPVTLVHDGVIHSPVPGGLLELKMADGTLLSFTGTQGQLVCFKGCAKAYLPRVWLSRGED
ncbi:hypothetical protein KR767_15455 [Luteibacter anthropi]|uniref:Uncharacterized protein n=1 Tax=Luteibacter anthropi TaxID=564369 RepID=A0A7X5ZIM1_9GAMM|nr:hypothetical protein [Luteibacter anthropi]NII06876.1 hypothetical protein [Luteibacter anthropi]URX61454.1 hypothetical protein KR767_15455 [Luteibacter anthropi]